MTKTAGGVALLLAFLLPGSAAFASGGSLFLTPASQTYTVGQQFDVQVHVNTGGAEASAAEAELIFDPTAISVDHISTDGSVVGSWATEPSFSNADGTMRFTGWMAQHYAGSDGLLLTVTFTALRTTAATIRFISGTILDASAADSNIITSMQSSNISIQPQVVAPVAQAPEVAPIPVVSPPPSAPTLATANSEIPAGANITASGTAEPNVTIYVWTQAGEAAPTKTVLTAGPDGSFRYVSSALAVPGAYYLWAQAEGKDGQKSALSQKVLITAKSNEAAAAALSGDAAGNLPPYLALGFVALLGAGYLYRRYRN